MRTSLLITLTTITLISFSMSNTSELSSEGQAVVGAIKDYPREAGTRVQKLLRENVNDLSSEDLETALTLARNTKENAEARISYCGAIDYYVEVRNHAAYVIRLLTEKLRQQSSAEQGKTSCIIL